MNPGGARFDALVEPGGEHVDPNWDGQWEAGTSRDTSGWTAEIRIPVEILSFPSNQGEWALNVQRRVQRLQETDRWAGPRQDYTVFQTSLAGVLAGLPGFDLGLGLSVRPSLVGGFSDPSLDVPAEGTLDPSLDATQRLGTNALASLTVNTDFAETEVDARRANLTRFPLFFPEKRSFFLDAADIFSFGLGLRVAVAVSVRVGPATAQSMYARSSPLTRPGRCWRWRRPTSPPRAVVEGT